MRELIYLSTAKLRSFTVEGRQDLFGDRGVKAAVPALGSIEISPGGSKEEGAAERLDRIIAVLEDSARASRWVGDPVLGPGDWVQFECEMMFGHFHGEGVDNQYYLHHLLGSALPRMDVVLFRGAVGDESIPWPRWRGPLTVRYGWTEVLLTGWAGHLLDPGPIHEASERMGSNTEDLYGFISKAVEADRTGGDDRSIASVEMPGTLEEKVRWLFNYPRWESSNEGFLRGHARVLRVLPQNEHSNRLVIATPLYVEYGDRPTAAAPVPVPSREPATGKKWYRFGR